MKRTIVALALGMAGIGDVTQSLFFSPEALTPRGWTSRGRDNRASALHNGSR